MATNVSSIVFGLCTIQLLRPSYSVIFESILFILTLLALLDQEAGHSFSKLTRILYLDGEFVYVAYYLQLTMY